MRYRNFTSLRTVLNLCAPVLFSIAAIFVCWLMSGKFIWPVLVLGFSYSLIAFLMNPQKYRNAFYVFEMNDTQIKNRFVAFRWEEIDQISLGVEEVRNLFLRKSLVWKNNVHQIYFVCIGSRNIQSLSSLSHKEVIYFTLSKRNIQMLQKFGGGKSTELDAFLSAHDDMWH